MLTMMVARTTSTTGTTTDSSTASAQPSLHEVKAMVSEAAKLHSDNDAAAQLGELGPQDNYIISCEDSYIEAYMCWSVILAPSPTTTNSRPLLFLIIY